MTPGDDQDLPLSGVGHDDALIALEQATKGQMILALRAILTDEMHTSDADELREVLHRVIHVKGPQYVYNALKNGA